MGYGILGIENRINRGGVMMASKYRQLLVYVVVALLYYLIPVFFDSRYRKCNVLTIDWNSVHRLCGFDAVFGKVWILLVFPDCDWSLVDSESLFTKWLCCLLYSDVCSCQSYRATHWIAIQKIVKNNPDHRWSGFFVFFRIRSDATNLFYIFWDIIFLDDKIYSVDCYF